jgi:UDP-N-acetylmuramoyl-tripeptide--D-alanyl-D-alanine ligase
MVQTVAEGGGQARRRIVVAGEMLELGDDSPKMHYESGERMARAGIDLLLGVRGLASQMVDGARKAGMSRDAARYFETSEDAAAALVDEVRGGDLILVKGSRGVETDRVVTLLRGRFPVVGADEAES